MTVSILFSDIRNSIKMIVPIEMITGCMRITVLICTYVIRFPFAMKSVDGDPVDS